MTPKQNAALPHRMKIARHSTHTSTTTSTVYSQGHSHGHSNSHLSSASNGIAGGGNGRAGLYSGSLSACEIAAGLGMGMAVTGGGSRRGHYRASAAAAAESVGGVVGDSNSNNNFFSSVTGMKRPGDLGHAHAMSKKKMGSASTVVSGSQFVFISSGHTAASSTGVHGGDESHVYTDGHASRGASKISSSLPPPPAAHSASSLFAHLNLKSRQAMKRKI